MQDFVENITDRYTSGHVVEIRQQHWKNDLSANYNTSFEFLDSSFPKHYLYTINPHKRTIIPEVKFE